MEVMRGERRGRENCHVADCCAVFHSASRVVVRRHAERLPRSAMASVSQRPIDQQHNDFICINVGHDRRLIGAKIDAFGGCVSVGDLVTGTRAQSK